MAIQEMAEELEELKREHPLTKYRDMLQALRDQIAEARRTLTAHQDEVKARQNKENFVKSHSLELTPMDKSDIRLLREFAPRMARQDSINKLIWTEWYQRPLQALRKSLDADKKTGIYIIRSVDDNRMYIGQAVDIGARWADHVKSGLGIGTTGYQSNKFYKAMHAKGPENFTFAILEECEAKDLNAREKHWIEFYNAVSFGYNSKAGG